MSCPGFKPSLPSGLIFFILFILFLQPFTGYSFAADPPGGETPEAEAKDENGMVRLADEGQNYLSERLHDFANWVDSFLGDERADAESRGSRLRLNTGVILGEGASLSYQFNVNLKLSLPRTSDRLKILIEGNSEEDLEGGQVPDGEGLGGTITDTDYSAAVRYVLWATRILRINADLGIRFSIPIDPFARLRIRRTFTLGDWEMRASETARWFVDAGFESVARIDFDTRVDDEDLFRATSRARWDDESENWEFSQFFSLFDILGPKSALTVSAGVVANTDAGDGYTDITEYVLGSSYRRDLHKGWFFLEVRPEIRFPRDRDYDYTPSVLFLVEAILGKTELD